jgi:hypothetical protein
MNDSEMRILFAAFAMLKMTWERGSDLDNAKDCFAIADAMVDASKFSPEDEVGIVAIKKKKRAT